MLSGERTKAMRPSRGGRLMVTPGVLQALTRRIDVVDREGEVAEIAAAGVFVLVPIVGEFDLGLGRLGRGDEHQREAAALVLDAARLGRARAC